MSLLDLMSNGGMETSQAVQQAAELAKKGRNELYQQYIYAINAGGYQGTFDDFVSQQTGQTMMPTETGPVQYQTPPYVPTQDYITSQYPRFVGGTPSIGGLLYQMLQYAKDPNTSMMR